MGTTDRATAMGASRKLLWGYDHLERLKKSIDAFNKSHPTRTTMKLKRDQAEQSVFNVEWSVVESTHPDGNWPLIIGDVLGCFRSALDHVVSEHVRLVGGVAETDSVMKYIWFPIADNPAAFRKDTKRLRELATPEFMTELERTQSYTFEPHEVGDYLPLTALRDLSNLDKHRGLPVTASYYDPSETFRRPAQMTILDSETILVRCEPGAVFANFQVTDGNPEIYMQMELEASRVETINVPGTTEPQAVIHLLETIGQDVMAIVGAFFSTPGEPEPSNNGGCVFPHAEPWQIPHP